MDLTHPPARRRISLGWVLCLVAGLASVGYLRSAGGAGARPLIGWAALSPGPGRPEPEALVRFLCVGGAAFDLGRAHGETAAGEGGLFVPGAEAARRCRPPELELGGGTRWLLSAAAPRAGYGAALVSREGGPDEALAALAGRLERGGWRPRGGPGGAAGRGRVFERDGAWLLVVAVDRDGRSTRLLVVVNDVTGGRRRG